MVNSYFRWIVCAVVLGGLLNAAEPLRVATSFTAPPLEFVRKRNFVGFEVDVVKAVAKQMGREVIFQDTPFKELAQSLNNDKCDLIMGGFIAGQVSGCWTKGYFSTPLAILTDSHYCPGICTLEGLRGKKVGMISGIGMESLDETPYRWYAPDCLLDALVDLTTGQIDALVHVHAMAVYLKFATPTLKVASLSEAPHLLVWGVKESFKEAVDQVLSQFTESQEFEQMTRRWFGNAATKNLNP